MFLKMIKVVKIIRTTDEKMVYWPLYCGAISVSELLYSGSGIDPVVPFLQNLGPSA